MKVFLQTYYSFWVALQCTNCARPQRSACFLHVVQLSYPIGVLAARFLLSWEDLRRCWLFVFLSISSGAVPALAIAIFSYEIPALFSECLAGLIFAL